MVLRLRSEAEMTSFLLVAAIAVAASWVAASTDLAPVDPLTAGVLGALGAGVLAGAVWSEDLWPTVVAAAAAAVGLVAGRNVGSLARSGGFFLSGATQGSLVHLDGVIMAAGALLAGAAPAGLSSPPFPFTGPAALPMVAESLWITRCRP